MWRALWKVRNDFIFKGIVIDPIKKLNIAKSDGSSTHF